MRGEHRRQVWWSECATWWGRAITLRPWCAWNPPRGRSGAQKGPKTASKRPISHPDRAK